jgi:Predicted membrane protein
MQERRIHQIFEVSVLLKGAHAAVEAVGGIALALTNNQWIRDFVTRATQNELIEDHRDFVADHLVTWAHGFSIETQHFYAWYLLSHGAVKLALVTGLLMRKLWAYPTTMVVLGLFILYQLYRYSETHGVGLLLLTALDVVVVGLTWHEYSLMMRHLAVD